MEDFTAVEGRLNHKQKRVPVLSSIEQDSDKEKLAANAILKVYSRDRAKRLSKNFLEPEMNHTGMEEVHEGSCSDFEGHEGSCSDFEGGKQLVVRPDFSSTSSFSDSKEIYLSNRATEEDFDLHLQGIICEHKSKGPGAE